jgi:hypothetical protein
VLALAAGCAARAPAPTPISKVDDSGPRLAIVETSPPRGSEIDALTQVRLVAEYSLTELQPGKDRITLVLKTAGGKTWEPAKSLLTKSQGRVAFELPGAELLKQPSLARPFQVLLVLDRADAADGPRMLKASEVVSFLAARTSENPLPSVNILPPSVGWAQLLSDPIHDPRYRPRLPPELDIAGARVWGLFKMCVDTSGAVYEVTALKSAHPAVDAQWMTLLRTYRHRPYFISRVAVPYCYPIRLEVRSN